MRLPIFTARLKMARVFFAIAAVVVVGRLLGGVAADDATPAPASDPVDRSPSALALTADERWLVTVNETSDTLSLIDVAAEKVVDEVPTGHRPKGLAIAPDQQRVLVCCAFSGELRAYRLENGRLAPAGALALGYEPRAVAIAPDGNVAYVALGSGAAVAVVDLASLTVLEKIEVGRWPRSVALSPDGSRLAVGTSGDQSISVVDTASRKLLFQEKFGGINAGDLAPSKDGQFVYFPWMIYRQNPIDQRNIRLGWVLGSRIARVRLDKSARRQAMTLDVPGKAVSDPTGICLTSDEGWLLATAPGTHELLAYRMQGLSLQDVGGPGDHIDPALALDSERFYRVELGGRPMGMQVTKDNRRVFVANYLTNAVQVVDLQTRQVAQTIDLGSAATPSLARQGEAIFFDGRRSLDQWYSCHTCHFEGGTNAVAMDTFNDGTPRTFKTVLSLRNVAQTGPWTWHGWQQDLRASLKKSMTETMLGPEPTESDVDALAAYFDQLEFAPNPHRGGETPASEAVQRGRAVFESDKAGCATCHGGPLLTDGQIHDVGLNSPKDVYPGYNTPSLVGAFNRVRFLHDGRVKSLRDALSGPHSPQKVSGQGELTPTELDDLIEYLKTL